MTLNSCTGDRTERTVPVQILPFDRIGADEAARAESLADTPAQETAGDGYVFEYEEDGGTEVTKIVKYENGGVAWRYTLSGRQLLSRYRECKAGVLFLYQDARRVSAGLFPVTAALVRQERTKKQTDQQSVCFCCVRPVQCFSV